MTPPPMNRFEAPTSSRTASPIPARPASSCASASYGSPRVGEGFRCSPKPHSSPKMKLRWRKPNQQNQQQQHHASFIPYLSQAGSSEPKSQTRCHHFVSLCIFFHFFVFERLPHLFTIPWLFKAIFGSFLRLRSIFRSISLSVVVSFRFISFFFVFRLHFIVCFISIYICMHSASLVDKFFSLDYSLFTLGHIFNFIDNLNLKLNASVWKMIVTSFF